MKNIAILTVSDSRTLDSDTSGKLIATKMANAGLSVVDRLIVNDDIVNIQTAYLQLEQQSPNIIITNGGTGIAQRDVTIPAIRRWATGNLPELTNFYYGAAGRCMELVILAATFYTYRMLGEWKGRKYQPIFLSAVKHLAKITFFLELAKKYWSKKQQRNFFCINVSVYCLRKVWFLWFMLCL